MRMNDIGIAPSVGRSLRDRRVSTASDVSAIGASPSRPSTTVRGVAWNRFLDLGRDEGGAVFVVTLAFFFLMYLVCCGVYAVSTAVCERIQLQNACDAAVYSAAVVQADTLSRIATINRAMAWTYVQMTRRQMDYIVLKWLKHTVEHYLQDWNCAWEWNANSAACALHRCPGIGWYVSNVRLNGSKNMSVDGIASVLSSILNAEGLDGISDLKRSVDALASDIKKWHSEKEHIGENGTADDGVEATEHTAEENEAERERIEKLQKEEEEWKAKLTSQMNSLLNNMGMDSGDFSPWSLQIKADKTVISAMNSAEPRLVWTMTTKIRSVVGDMVSANVPSYLKKHSQYFLRHCTNPLEYFECLKNNSDGERRFVSFADYTESLYRVFNESSLVAGVDQWFVRGDGEKRTKNEIGLQRSYKHWDDGHGVHGRPPSKSASCVNEKEDNIPRSVALYSEWKWWSWKWQYIPPSPFTPDQHIREAYASNCPHRWWDDRCRPYGPDNYARCYADEPEIYNDNYIGAKALPLVLRKDYFGKDGTIVVGIVRRNQNVWERILGAIDGVFRAFDPDWTGDVDTSKTFVFASAKAGYVDKTADRAADAQRIDYRIDWQTRNQDWNLCQGNWDAVFVPVRMSNSLAKDGKWEDADENVLEDLIGSAQWRSLDGEPAGIGAWREIFAPRLMNGVDSGRMYVDGFSAEQGRVELQYSTDGGKSKNLDWEGLSHVLYH